MAQVCMRRVVCCAVCRPSADVHTPPPPPPSPPPPSTCRCVLLCPTAFVQLQRRYRIAVVDQRPKSSCFLFHIQASTRVFGNVMQHVTERLQGHHEQERQGGLSCRCVSFQGGQGGAGCKPLFGNILFRRLWAASRCVTQPRR